MNERSISEVSLGRRPPVWVPDSHSTKCQECEIKFTFILRKHHCRACGRLLCADCTQNQEPLQYLGWRYARVCDRCRDTIRKPSTVRGVIRKTKSFNDFQEMKLNLSKLIMRHKLSEAEQSDVSESELMSLLPPELLTRILQYLSFDDLKASRQVCHAWLLAVSQTNFYKECWVNIAGDTEEIDGALNLFANTINSSFRHFNLVAVSFDRRIAFLQEPFCEYIQSIVLSNSQVSGNDVLNILNKTSGLKSFGLINCKQLFMSGTFLSNSKDKEIAKKGLNCLEKLFLDNNSYLSDVLLHRITSCISTLKHFSLENSNIMNHNQGVVTKIQPECGEIPASSSVITWRIVVSIIRGFAATLQSINIARNTGIKIEDLCDMPELKLELLNIEGCSSISAEGFAAFMGTQQNLRSINFASSRKILSVIKEEAKSIFTLMNGLRKIDLSENSISHLSGLASVEKLSFLSMNNLDSPGSSIASTFLSLDTSHLKSLEARNISISSSDLSKIIHEKNLKSLRKLDLSRGGDDVITDNVMKAICGNLTELEYLDVSHNVNITDIGTLNLEDDNVRDSLNQVIAGKISLGSRAENQIVLEGKTQNVVLDLVKETNIEDECIGKLSNLKKLRHLDLSGTSVTSLTLSHGIKSPDLRFFSVSDVRGALFSDEGLKVLSLNHRRISHLGIASTCVTNIGLASCIVNLKRLKYLDIRRCSQLTSEFLPAVAQLSPQLSYLLLSGCAGVTPDIIKCVIQSFYNLKKIDI